MSPSLRPSVPSGERSSLPLTILEWTSVVLIGGALALIQILIGGTRGVFSLPSYGLLALAGLLSALALRSYRPKPDAVCLYAAAVFFGYILARAILSPVDYWARSDIYSVLAGLVVYGLTACVITSARHRLGILSMLLVLALAQVLIGAIQFRDGNNFMPIAFLQRFDYGRRASGFYICPNHLAGALEVVAMFGLSVVCWSRLKAWAKLLLGYLTLVCCVGILLTGSRGGYLSMLTGFTVFFLMSLAALRRAKPGLFWKMAVVSIVAAIVLGATSFYLVQKSGYFKDRVETASGASTFRFDLWRSAIDQWKLAPAFGAGSGMFRVYGRMFRSERVQLDPMQVHNDYLHLLADYGVLGAAGFLLFLGAHLRSGWRNFKKLGSKRIAVSGRLLSNGLALNIGATAAVGTYVMHSVFDFNLHIPANVLLMAFVFGILANAGTQRDSTNGQVRGGALVPRVVLVVLALVLAIQSARLFPSEYYGEKARTALRDYRNIDSIYFARRALDYEKRDPNLFYYLGRARSQLGDQMRDAAARQSFYEAALENYYAAHRIAPLDKTYAIEAALTLDVLQRFEEAEWMFGIALELDPRSMATRRYYEAHLERWGKSGTNEEGTERAEG